MLTKPEIHETPLDWAANVSMRRFVAFALEISTPLFLEPKLEKPMHKTSTRFETVVREAADSSRSCTKVMRSGELAKMRNRLEADERLTQDIKRQEELARLQAMARFD